MHHRVVRQHLDCLAPCSVHGFILGRGHGEQFRQTNLEDDRDVSVFANDTAVFHSEQRQFDSSVVAFSIFLIVFYL